MAVPQWVAASPSASRSASVASSTRSSASSVSAVTNGSFRYVPPNLRRDRNIARVEVELAELGNKLASEHRESAKHTGPRLPYFQLPYCLTKQQLNFLTDRFPRTTFRCTSDGMHDHPIAHTETMIACEKAKRMVPEGHTIIDLFGSPTDADRFNAGQARANRPKRMVPYVAIKTEKDYLRALKWGDALGPNGLRYVEGTGDILDEIEPTNNGVAEGFGVTSPGALTYFCKHTMYYLSDEEIAGLLKPEGSRMLSVVHRHPNTQGSLFQGECTYGKIAGCVEQVNALTMERYVHRDLSWLWDSQTKVVRTEKGAFVWTFHMVSPDTWIVELTGCNMRLDERFRSREKFLGVRKAAEELNEHSLSATRFPHPALASLPGANCKMLGGVPLISFKNVDLPPVKLSSPELYDFLRTAQAGKPRDADRLHDLFALARTHIANGSDFPGKRNFTVPPADIAGHVGLAFVSDLASEVELLRAIEGYKIFAREHKALLDGSAVVVNFPNENPETSVRSAISVLNRINAARKRGDIIDGILDVVQ